MTLYQSLTSLPLSKRLKELGVKQDSLFWWVLDGVSDGGWSLLFEADVFNLRNERFERISAFSVAELGEMLKARYQPHESSYASSTVPIFVGDGYAWFQNGEIIVHATTEADARAKMLIHLIESGIVKV